MVTYKIKAFNDSNKEIFTDAAKNISIAKRITKKLFNQYFNVKRIDIYKNEKELIYIVGKTDKGLLCYKNNGFNSFVAVRGF